MKGIGFLTFIYLVLIESSLNANYQLLKKPDVLFRRKFPVFENGISFLRLRGGGLESVGLTKLGPTSNIVGPVVEKLGRNLHNQQDHPLQVIKSWIEHHFAQTYLDKDGGPLFATFDNLNPVVTTKQCFDDLLTPLDHVSRSRNDTYYVDDERILRSHMTAHQTTLLRDGQRHFLYSGDVYRRDSVDACHYFCFHQMDGVRVFSWDELGVGGHEDAIPRVMDDLKKTLSGMVKSIFGDVQMRWVESYFPFTEPSLEVEIWFKEEWLEVLGCGAIRPAILAQAGLAQHSGWAFGLGLERLAMVLFDVPDIRLFWSTDARFLRQFEGAAERPGVAVHYVGVSKYPVCYKDVAFWHGPDFHEHDLAEALREEAGDVAESLTLLSTFVHPKTGRPSRCYRICYRAADRTLTNGEADTIQARLCRRLVDSMGLALR